MNQNDNHIALIDPQSAEQIASLLATDPEKHGFLGLSPDDILSVPGVAHLIRSRALARLNTSAGVENSPPGDDDAEVETELRRDQAAGSLTKFVELMTTQVRAMSPDASCITILRHADLRLEEAMQQFVVDLMALGAAVLNGARQGPPTSTQ